MADTNNTTTTSEIHDERGKFKQGNKANPAGRPVGSTNTPSFKEDFEKAIAGLQDKEGNPITMENIIKLGIIKMAKGDMQFASLHKDILDRYYGKPKQSIDHTTLGKAFTPSAEQQALADSAIDEFLQKNEDTGNTSRE